ncbi:MAG TPA: hypothetical protein VJK51_03525 [Candidatus Nanoarchaeia archaeon]|nr:hypothetical protein [Candidatus Nanoarchaeia archaeon]
MELISLKKISKESKLLLLKGFGFSSDGEYILDAQGNVVIDKYVDVPVRVDNMLILPGSTLILDDNELSLSRYLEEFGNVL